MTHHYVLDGNVFLSRTEVIAAIEPDAEISVSHEILEDIEDALLLGRLSTRRFARVVALVNEKRVRLKFVPRLPRDEDSSQDALLSALSSGLPPREVEVASIALNLVKEHSSDSVTVISDSNSLAHFLRSNGISTLHATEVLRRNAGLVNAELLAQLVNFSREMLAKAVLSMVGGGVISGVLGVLFTHRERIFSTFPLWGTILILPITGIAFYWFRERYRLSYGAAETGVGLLTMYSAVFVGFDFSSVDYGHPVQILGGLYVMVRGLDNIAKGLQGTRLAPMWNRYFSGH
jgi:hypothetical protein